MFSISSASVKNNIYADKPNEDSYFIAEDIGAFGVLDGVSRDAINGIYPNPSPSYNASHLICDVISSELFLQTNVENAVLKANDAVLQYNIKNNVNSAFHAGAVGVFCAIKNYNMSYSYIGDSFGFIVRGNMIFPFTHKQTADIIEKFDTFPLDFIRTNICNNPNHIYGYGVINGNPTMENFIVSGSIKLKPGDIVFLCSDGCDNVLESADISDLNSLSAEDLIEKYCSGEDQDDRTMIKIRIK